MGDMWKGLEERGVAEGWEEELIIPIVKKGEGKKVGEYMGPTIMPFLYRIYATMLAKRLDEETEGKGIVLPNQIGFGRGTGTIDNIYVLNHLVYRQVARRKAKLIALYVDLRAAFDFLDREIMEKTIRDRGVREGLIERVKEIYEETKSRVKVGGEIGDEFWTVRGVRQGCPLSPSLFNILTADMEEKMGRQA